MKKIALVLPVLALTACDRPQYDVRLACEDAAKGQLLVDAKIYKSHADLVVKRLNKKLREKAQGRDEMWMADHAWLYNQIPQIDDRIQISLPVNEDGSYELAGKIKLELTHDKLTGGLGFFIWHAADNKLTSVDGGYEVGTPCDLVFEPIDVMPKSISKEIKNCLNYVGSQLLYDSTPTEKRLRVYDENTGREMFIGIDVVGEIFNGLDASHFYLETAAKYPEDALHACDVAARLRAYIAEHIDAEYITQPDAIVVSPGDEMSLMCGDDEIFIRGEQKK